MAAGGGGTAAGTGCWGRLGCTQARAVTRGDGGVMWDRGVGAGGTWGVPVPCVPTVRGVWRGSQCAGGVRAGAGGIGPAWACRTGTRMCLCVCTCVHACACALPSACGSGHFTGAGTVAPCALALGGVPSLPGRAWRWPCRSLPHGRAGWEEEEPSQRKPHPSSSSRPSSILSPGLSGILPVQPSPRWDPWGGRTEGPRHGDTVVPWAPLPVPSHPQPPQ